MENAKDIKAEVIDDVVDEFAEEAYYEEPDRRTDIIGACYSALVSIETVTTGLNKTHDAIIKRVKRRCLHLIDYYIAEMYYEAFAEETENEDD